MGLDLHAPCMIPGLARDWPASQKWTFDFFRSQYGHLTVEVKRHARRGKASRRMRLDHYIDYLLTTQEASPYYLASWDFLPIAPELCQDFSLSPFWRDDWLVQVSEELRPRLLWLFLGPARTGFALHIDVGHTAAWNTQLVGRKRWAIFPPDHDDILYQGEVNAFQPDLQRHPNFSRAQGLYYTQEAGDTVYIPSRWWHQTEILEASIAVSGNFANQHNIQVVLQWLAEHDHPELHRELSGIRDSQR